MGKVLRSSNIHLILEGAAGKPVKLIQVNKLLQSTGMLFLIFFLHKNDSYFLKLICFFSQKNLVLKVFAIKNPSSDIAFWKLTELFT